MKQSILLGISILIILSAASAQDCSKYLKKKKPTTKDQPLGSVMLDKHLIAFVKDGGNYKLEYYKSNIKQGGPKGAMLNATVTSIAMDTIEVNFEFAKHDPVTFYFLMEGSKVQAASIRGSALRHYFHNLTEEQMQLFVDERIKKYRVIFYGVAVDNKKRSEQKKWRTIKADYAVDIQNAAKCLINSK